MAVAPHRTAPRGLGSDDTFLYQTEAAGYRPSAAVKAQQATEGKTKGATEDFPSGEPHAPRKGVRIVEI